MFDKLITINFPHSYGGDFLATLIMGDELKITEGCTVWYYTPGVESAYGVKNLDIIVGLWRSDLYKEYFFTQDTRFSKRQVNYFEIVFDTDPDQFKRNIIDDLQHQLDHLKDSLNVFNTHYSYGNQSFLPLSEIFPGSTNLTLGLDNKSNESIYKFMFNKKALEYHQNTSVYSFYRDMAPSYIDSEKMIYVDRLLFESGHTYAAEIQEMLGVEFKMSDLDMYKEAHKKLLIDNGLQYESLPHW